MSVEPTVQPTSIKKRRKTLLGFVPEESIFYNLHPATRLIIFIVSGFAPIWIDLPEINIAIIVLLLVLFTVGGVDLSRLKIYLPMMVTVAIFMFGIRFLFPAYESGYIPMRVGPFTVYYQPIFWAFISYWRIFALVFASIFYFSTNRENDTLIALRAFRTPFAATYLMALSLRSAGMFMEDFSIIRQAEQARGLDTDALSLRDKIKLYTMYTVPLFSIAIRRATEVSAALFARGYTISGKPPGKKKRAVYVLTRYPFKGLDWFVSIFFVLLFVITVYLQSVHGTFRIEHSPMNHFFYNLVTR
jgi:energy-coupling factor transporter transmembrane protein EcfT